MVDVREKQKTTSLESRYNTFLRQDRLASRETLLSRGYSESQISDMTDAQLNSNAFGTTSSRFNHLTEEAVYREARARGMAEIPESKQDHRRRESIAWLERQDRSDGYIVLSPLNTHDNDALREFIVNHRDNRAPTRFLMGELGSDATRMEKTVRNPEQPAIAIRSYYFHRLYHMSDLEKNFWSVYRAEEEAYHEGFNVKVYFGYVQYKDSEEPPYKYFSANKGKQQLFNGEEFEIRKAEHGRELLKLMTVQMLREHYEHNQGSGWSVVALTEMKIEVRSIADSILASIGCDHSEEMKKVIQGFAVKHGILQWSHKDFNAHNLCVFLTLAAAQWEQKNKRGARIPRDKKKKKVVTSSNLDEEKEELFQLEEKVADPAKAEKTTNYFFIKKAKKLWEEFYGKDYKPRYPGVRWFELEKIEQHFKVRFKLYHINTIKKGPKVFNVMQKDHAEELVQFDTVESVDFPTVHAIVTSDNNPNKLLRDFHMSFVSEYRVQPQEELEPFPLKNVKEAVEPQGLATEKRDVDFYLSGAYVCEHCLQRFTRVDNLSRHYKNNTCVKDKRCFRKADDKFPEPLPIKKEQEPMKVLIDRFCNFGHLQKTDLDDDDLDHFDPTLPDMLPDPTLDVELDYGVAVVDDELYNIPTDDAQDMEVVDEVEDDRYVKFPFWIQTENVMMFDTEANTVKTDEVHETHLSDEILDQYDNNANLISTPAEEVKDGGQTVSVEDDWVDLALTAEQSLMFEEDRFSKKNELVYQKIDESFKPNRSAAPVLKAPGPPCIAEESVEVKRQKERDFLDTLLTNYPNETEEEIRDIYRTILVFYLPWVEKKTVMYHTLSLPKENRRAYLEQRYTELKLARDAKEKAVLKKVYGVQHMVSYACATLLDMSNSPGWVSCDHFGVNATKRLYGTLDKPVWVRFRSFTDRKEDGSFYTSEELVTLFFKDAEEARKVLSTKMRKQYAPLLKYYTNEYRRVQEYQRLNGVTKPKCTVEYLNLQRVKQFLDRLVILGFNSSGYDIPLMKQDGFFNHMSDFQPNFKDEHVQQLVGIKDGTKYKALMNSKFQFLDLKLFSPAGASLDGLCKLFKTVTTKGKFPYELLSTPEAVDSKRTQDLTITDYGSRLQNRQCCTEQEYKDIREFFKQHPNILTLKDLLYYYNVSDTLPMLEILDRLVNFWQKRVVCMLSHITMPSCASYFIQREIWNEPVTLPGDDLEMYYAQYVDETEARVKAHGVTDIHYETGGLAAVPDMYSDDFLKEKLVQYKQQDLGKNRAVADFVTLEEFKTKICKARNQCIYCDVKLVASETVTVTVEPKPKKKSTRKRMTKGRPKRKSVKRKRTQSLSEEEEEEQPRQSNPFVDAEAKVDDNLSETDMEEPLSEFGPASASDSDEMNGPADSYETYAKQVVTGRPTPPAKENKPETKSIPAPNTMTLDRIRNGKCHTNVNTVLCCLSCNTRKSNTSLRSWLEPILRDRWVKKYSPQVYDFTEKNKDVYDTLRDPKNLNGGFAGPFRRFLQTGDTMEKFSQWNPEEGRYDLVSFDNPQVCEVIWSLDVTSMYPHCMAFKDMLCGPLEFEDFSYFTDAQKQRVLDLIKSGEWFGVLEATMYVPENLMTHFAVFPPFCRKECIGAKRIEHPPNSGKWITVDEDQVSPTMIDAWRDMDRPTRENSVPMAPVGGAQHGKVIMGMRSAELQLFTTEQIKWYLEHGLECSAIGRFASAQRGQPYREVLKRLLEIRKRASCELCFKNAKPGSVPDPKCVYNVKNYPKKDESIPIYPEHLKEKALCEHTKRREKHEAEQPDHLSPEDQIEGDLIKLLCNSAYGQFSMDPSSFVHVKYGDLADAVRKSLEGPKFFKEANAVAPELYEIESLKKQVSYRFPKAVSVGYCILSYAKLMLLEFVYDFLDKYFPRNTWTLCYSDTDSMVTGFSSKNMDSLVKEGLAEAYRIDKPRFMALDGTSKEAMNDFRTTGKFKNEKSADWYVGLAAKSYKLGQKMGTKGISMSKNPGLQDKSIWLDMASRKLTGYVAVNNSLVYTKGEMQLQLAHRTLSAYFDKGWVHPDLVHISPLDRYKETTALTPMSYEDYRDWQELQDPSFDFYNE